MWFVGLAKVNLSFILFVNQYIKFYALKKDITGEKILELTLEMYWLHAQTRPPCLITPTLEISMKTN